MAGPYVAGSLIRVSSYGGTIAFPTDGYRDINGNLIDPASVILTYIDGQGTRHTVTYPTAPIIKDGTGLYHADLDTTSLAGSWSYEWSSTGTGQAAKIGTFIVTAGL